MSRFLEGEEELLRVWVMVSQVQFWLILVIIFISVGVISWALVRLFRLKKSHHFQFLIWIIVADLTTLFIILIDIMSQSLFMSMKDIVFIYIFPGPFLCKILLFLSNTSVCFVNWVWLVMFVQRCAVILFPMKRDRQGLMGFVRNTKKLILGTGIVAVITQSWPLVLVTERYVSTNDGLVAVTCERDTKIMSDEGYKLVAFFEAAFTYVCPFACTILADLLVLCCHNNEPKFAILSSDLVFRFTVLSSDLVSKTQSSCQQPAEGLKIQSRESLRLSHLRRQRAIRRCLFMATVQMILNTPYYTLQLIDEVYSLQSTPSGLLTYLYMDAVLYLLYLCQFPLVALYISALYSDMKSGDRKERIRQSTVSTSTLRQGSFRGERQPLAPVRSREVI